MQFKSIFCLFSVLLMVQACSVYAMSIHEAAAQGDLETVRRLIEEDHNNISLKGFMEEPPLHRAALKGHLKVVQYLIEQGANVNARAKDKCTPLHLAALKGHLKVVKYLIAHGADVNAKDTEKLSPMYFAAMKGHLESVQYLVEQEKETLRCSLSLLEAAATNDIRSLKMLIGLQADINVYGLQGNTPLHHVAQCGHWRAAYNLLINGADPMLKNYNGETPFQAALSHFRYNVVGLFFILGAKDRQQADKFSTFWSSYMRAIKYSEVPQEGPKSGRCIARE